MAKKALKGDYVTFEVRASYDKKTDSIHLTSKDKDISTANGFHLTLNRGKDAEYALRTLLEQKGIIPEEQYLPVKAYYGDSRLHHVWDRFPVGVHADGTEAVWNSSSSNNVLIAGPTGAGKSVIQRNILFHCIQNSDKWSVLGIDLKGGELTPYKKHSPAVMNVVTTVADGVEILRYAHGEMQKRYELMRHLDVSHLREIDHRPKSLMVMVDQLLMFLARLESDTPEARAENLLKAEARYLLNRIAMLGRPAGIHLVLSAQRIDKKVMTNELVENCTTRIASGRLDSSASKALLGNDEAYLLNGGIKGRGYMQEDGEGAGFQGYFAPEDFLDGPRC